MNDRKRLKDVLSAIEAIESYRVSSYAEFQSNPKTQDAIFNNLISTRDITELKSRIVKALDEI